MEELKQRLLTRFKALKGISDDSQDDVFLFAIELAVNAVLAYCHLDILEWPVLLDTAVVMMAVDAYNEATLSANLDTAEAEVTSLKEGDFSIETTSKVQIMSRLASQPTFAKNYRSMLNQFRKLAR